MKKEAILVISLVITLFLINNTLANGVIVSCGGTISSPGIYNLTGNLVSSDSNCITIGSNDVTIDGKGYNITGDGTTNGISAESYNNTIIKDISNIIGFENGISVQDSINVTVQNLSITYSIYDGILIFTSSNITINNVNLTGNPYGIEVVYNDENINITNSFIDNSSTRGISVDGSDKTNIINNTIKNSVRGIALYYLTQSFLDNNSMINNTQSFSIFSNEESDYNNTILTTNTIDNSYIVYYNYSISNYTFNTSTAPSAGTVICGGCYNITIADLNLSHYNRYGAYLVYTNNSIIKNISSNHNYEGTYLYFSSNNQIINSTFNYNGNNGIILEGNSSNNIINNATLYGNYDGLWVSDYSSNNTITSVYASSSQYRGISLSEYANDNNFYNNTCFNNSIGILLRKDSHDNNFTGGMINSSIQSAIVLAVYDSDYNGTANNTFTSIQIHNTNSSYYDIEYQNSGLNRTTFVDMPSIGNYSFNLSNEVLIKNSSYGEIKFTDSLNGTGTNMSSDITFGNNSIYINTNSPFNTNANITLYGIGNRGYSNPQILKDGSICTDCSNFTSLTASNVIFNITSGGIYSIGTPATTSSSSSQESSTFSTYPLFQTSQENLEKGYEKVMRKKWEIKFSLENEVHTLTLEDISGDYVKIGIHSKYQVATIHASEEKKFDLNEDGYYDLSVKVESIAYSNSTYDTAKIVMQSINEPIPQQNDNTNPGILNSIKNNFGIYLLILTLIAIAIAGYFYLIKVYLPDRELKRMYKKIKVR